MDDLSSLDTSLITEIHLASSDLSWIFRSICYRLDPSII